MIRKIADTYSYLLSLIRWNDWYDVRTPFVFIVVLYFQYTTAFLGNGGIAYLKFITIFLFSLCYYAFLFLTNDYFDFDQDVHSAKGDKNRSRILMLLLIGLSFITSASFLLLSWNTYSPVYALTAAFGYGLAFFYSAPPLRFKERNYWGIIVGSTVLRPMCILMILAGLDPNKNFYEVIIYTLWMEIFGIRTMLFHQIGDYQNDLKTRVRTFVMQHGKQHAYKLIISILLPAEMIILLAVIIIMTINIPNLVYLVIVYGLYLVWTGGWHKWAWKNVPHYRPLLGNIVFFLLPVYLAMLVAIKYSLWLLPIFILYWQKRFVKEFLQRFHV